MRPFRSGLLLLALAAMGGCQSPAAPPKPPAEIPALLTFPSSVSIDVSTIASSLPEESAAALVGPDGEFSNVIAIGGDEAQAIQNDVLEGLLSPFTQFEIPVGPDVTTFAATIPAEAGVLPESFKFDFSDFDFDGDGANEGCTGCTCPLGCGTASCPTSSDPADLKRVCFRIWIQRDPDFPFERVMAGFFDVLPTPDDPATASVDESNPGKGRFHAGVDRSDPALGPDRFLVGVVYDHRNFDRPEDRTTEAFLLADARNEKGELLAPTTNHDLITEVEKTDPAGKKYQEKTVRTHFEGSESEENPSLVSVLEYAGRFRDDADFWSGSVVDTSTGAPLHVPNTCARISTGDGSEGRNCTDLGIDAADLDVTLGKGIRKTEETDVVFPADFPALPTF